MNACICSRSSSGIVHHGRRRVAHLAPVDKAGDGGGGLVVYITQWCGRGSISPICLYKPSADTSVVVVATTAIATCIVVAIDGGATAADVSAAHVSSSIV